VKHGFGSTVLSILTGFAVTVAVAISAASIARGAISYLAELLPWPPWLLLLLLILTCTAIAAYGVKQSVWLAAAFGIIEIGGLIAATVVGLLVAPELHMRSMLPADIAGWRGTFAGAFIAFFAFIGFETLANMAEETKDPNRTVPLGILGAVTASIILYVAVAAAAVLSDSTADRPLLDIFSGAGTWLFAAIGFLAVANGALVQIVMLSRLFYGMACNEQLPSLFGRVNAGTGTPLPATMLAGCIVTITAIVVSFEQLLVLSNLLTLAIFVLVDLALWRLKLIGDPISPGFSAPVWVPSAAAVLAVSLMLTEVGW
jgi:amino acid transporter